LGSEPVEKRPIYAIGDSMINAQNPGNLICIRKLKDIALAKGPHDHPLRTVLLAERDCLTREEFKAKLETWLNMLEFKN